MRSGKRCRPPICDLTLWHVHAAVCYVFAQCFDAVAPGPNLQVPV